MKSRISVTGNPAYDGRPFTAFATVTPETDVASLNLNWGERDLPERERTKHVHGLHPYLGKFIPQLVEVFLRKYRPKVVCDPFCGSGTTLVEANALGIDAVGCDISAFNCLLTKVKTYRYDLRLLERSVHDILVQLDLRLQPNLFGAPQEVEESQSEYLRAWYTPEVLRQLLLYRSLISAYPYQDLLKVVLSRAARSSRLTKHFELDFPKAPVTGPYYCHKHRRTCYPVTDATAFLRRYSLDALRRIETFARIRTEARTEILQGDARSVAFPPCDMVLTSPPYVGLIDYHEQHRYAFELLGLPQSREAEIGASWKGDSQRAVETYLEDMTEAFANVMRAMPSGGVLVVIVHDRKDLYDRIAQRLGVKVEYRLQRHVNRRTGRRADAFFEDVLVWRRL
ncbi:DNA methyltransferase [Geochorda subterranea]|uniref:site-specific DNA-methyltransferase (cytosine-N(4)-specific) n=1 Tax=Geochorda subterranea TaxID=3109564 RepID=A0ABZ1BP46_9FIRM|nr:DNA methyltransferase [Limnochorda sp. LNt]WRP14494.1 DNA methyltransferase [Limnochorda sp. LNt]